MTTGTILIVDDNKTIRSTFSRMLEKEGYSVQVAADGKEALVKLKDTPFDLVITDVRMPGMDGMELVRQIGTLALQPDIIVMTAYAKVEDAVNAIKEGAYDYLTKPLDVEDLRHKVQMVMEKRGLEKRVSSLEQELRGRYDFRNIVGATPEMKKVYEMIDKMRMAECNVLIQGESGTGKEVVARAIHYNGPLAKKPFVAIGCGALPGTIVERELFGHEKEAFTDAKSTKPGYFEAADGGTLFLDEITDLGLDVQAKLLRVIEENQFFRLGGTKPVKVQVRLLSAANKNVRSCVEDGTFREDLFYRISLVTIDLPPLRQRRDDVPLLIRHFLGKHADKYGKTEPSIEKKAENALLHYDWPGNVRELEHIIERALALMDGNAVRPGDLPENVVSSAGSSYLADDDDLPYAEARRRQIESFERDAVSRHLEEAGGNVTEAARRMGIQRTVLYRLLKKYGFQ